MNLHQHLSRIFTQKLETASQITRNAVITHLKTALQDFQTASDDENPIRTLRDYSKPSHEGYRNTIELPIGNNIVPLRSDTIRLVQNGCSFHGLRSEDPNQHLKDFLKLVDSLDLDGENRERRRLCLFQFSLHDQASNWLERLPAGSITTWEDLTTRFLAQFFLPGRTAKLHNDILMFQQHHGESLSEAWTRFKDLLRKVPHHGLDLWLQIQIFYDHVDDTIQKGIDYAADWRLRKLRPDEAWSAIKRITQLEDYMQVTAEEFMEFSSKVTRRLKERIKENKNKPRKIEKITKYPDTKVLENSAKHDFLENLEKKAFPTPANLLCAMIKRARSTMGQTSSSREETIEEKVRKFGLFNNRNHQMNYNNLAGRSIHSGDVADWEFLSNKGLAQPFFDFINTDTFFGPQWVNLFQINEPISRELVREFFASFEFDATPCRDVVTLSGLRNVETVNATRLTHSFWSTIGDGMFNVENTKAQSIRNPRIKLAHRCITITITGRKETTNHVIEIDLFYLYCIFREGVVCNIPYWLAKYLKSVRDKSVIFGGMFVTKIAWSFGLLTNEMVSDVGRLLERLWRKVEVMMRKAMEKGETKELGGFEDIYRNKSQGDWQLCQAHWMDQHDEHWGRINACMGQQDERAH
ncbi:zinc finger, CCHC-type containing protein [Tanacetum coccineum]